MATLVPLPWQFFDDNGTPLDGCKLYSYEGGSNYAVAKNTYTTDEGNVANANPTIYDAGGKAQIWLGEGIYDFRLYDKNDILVETWDGIGGTDSLTSTVTVETMQDLRDLDPGVYDSVYLLGYNAVNDGGGGFFSWSASSIVADDNGCVIQPNTLPASGRWLRMNDEFVTPKMFGANAPGITDDSASIIDANAYAAANNMYINFTSGIYRVSSDVTLTAKSAIQNGATINIANGYSLSGLDLCNDPQHCFIGCALADVPTLENATIRPVWFNNDLNKTVLALPSTGGDILLEEMVYEPITSTITARTNFIGKKQPVFNSGYTGLEKGTIIKGPLEITTSNNKIKNLGIDSGYNVCKTLYGDVAQDGLTVDGSDLVVDIDGLTVLCLNRAQKTNITLTNIVNSKLSKIYTQYGATGIKIIGQNIVADRIVCFDHATNGIFITNTTTKTSGNIVFSDVLIDSQTHEGTYGFHVEAVDSSVAIEGITVQSLIVRYYLTGVYTTGETVDVAYISIQLRYIPGDNAIANYQLSGSTDLTTVSIDVGDYGTDIDTIEGDISTLETNVTTLLTAVGEITYGTFTLAGRAADWSGTPPSVTVHYKKTEPAAGVTNAQATVELSIPLISGTSISSEIVMTTLPAGLRPIGGYFRRYFLCQVFDNTNTETFGQIMIEQSGGNVTISKYPTGTFTSQNTKGMHQTIIKYSLT
jgi:hypothetical protein